MILGPVLVAAVLGLAAGSAISVVAWRIPQGFPLRAGSTADGAELTAMGVDVPLLRVLPRQPAILRAAAAPGRGPAVAVRPPLLELLTCGLFAVMVLRFGVSWTLPAYVFLAAAAVLLAVIDLQHLRLPNVIVGPLAVLTPILLVVAAVGQGTWEPLSRAAIGGVALFFVYLILALISPSGLGMGDVKLAGVLGWYLAYLSWRTLIYGAAGGFVISALVSVVLLATRRVDRRAHLPFGPSMLLAAVLAVIVGAGALTPVQ
jgi:leader peptidase (prepilin peptidase)/N-methyltransferase